MGNKAEHEEEDGDGDDEEKEAVQRCQRPPAPQQWWGGVPGEAACRPETPHSESSEGSQVSPSTRHTAET